MSLLRLNDFTPGTTIISEFGFILLKVVSNE